MDHDITSVTEYVYGVLVGDIPNNDKSFFAIGGDIVQKKDDRLVLHMDDGKKYEIRIMENN